MSLTRAWSAVRDGLAPLPLLAALFFQAGMPPGLSSVSRAVLTIAALLLTALSGDGRPRAAFAVLASGLLLRLLDADGFAWMLWSAAVYGFVAQPGRSRAVWAWTALLYAFAGQLLPARLPGWSYVLESVVPRFLCGSAARAVPGFPELGRSAAGVDGYLLWACAALAEGLLERKIRRPGLSALLFGASAAAAWGFVLFPRFTGEAAAETARGAAHSVHAWLLLGLALRAAWARAGRDEGEAAEPRRAALSFAAAALVIGVASFPDGWTSKRDPSTIVVLNEGGLDWDVPRHGEYGLFSGGMFGLLPEYVRGLRPTSFADLPAALDARPDALLIINGHRVWGAPERERVYRYVEEGGGLLVLGDHTDVFGLMKGLNSLVAPAGIAFNFDSAYPEDATFHGKLRALPGALADSRGGGFEIAIGASLEARPPAVALLRGQYAFSDLGERKNVLGSYLGNYHYDPGERYGDVPIVAAAAWGRGRIVALGDTSGFQNGPLPSSAHDVVLPLLRWAASGTPWLDRPSGRVVLALLSLGLLGLAVARMPSSRGAAALAAGLLIGSTASLRLARAELWRPSALSARAVAVDYRCHPAVGHYEAGGNSIGPLYTNLARAGLAPYDLRPGAPWRPSDFRAVVCVDPALSPDETMAAEYLRYVEDGGVLILAADPDSARRFRRVLEPLGLGVRPLPLGPLPPRLRRPKETREELDGLQDTSPLRRAALVGDPEAPSGPTFVSAWALESATPELTETLYRVGEHLVALSRAHGKGRLVLIGDTRVFSTANAEGPWGHNLPTLRWFYVLFRSIPGASGAALDPAFPAPAAPPEER